MTEASEKIKKTEDKHSSERKYLIFFILLFAGLGFALAFPSELRSCSYTSDYGIPSNYLDTMPAKLEIEQNFSGDYTFYALDDSGSRFCKFSSEESHAIVSPDGQSIVFQFFYYPDIFVSSIAGNNVRELTESLQYPARFPKWSPDSQRIAFTYGEIDDWVYVVSPDGSYLHGFQLDGSIGYSKNWAAWSPDAQWLAIAVLDGPGASGNVGIYLMDRDAISLEQITQGQLNNLPGNPQWDETGEYITFASGGEHDRELFDEVYNEQCRIGIFMRVLECESVEAFQVP
jgi:hypothetical protein